MNLIIPFTQSEEALLTAVARRTGVAPAELIKRLTLEHLPPISMTADDELNFKLRTWQQKDGTPLMADIPTTALYAKWAEEDANMTNAERDAEDTLWEGIEKEFAETNGLCLR